jgi:hypothetical protein
MAGAGPPFAACGKNRIPPGYLSSDYNGKRNFSIGIFIKFIKYLFHKLILPFMPITVGKNT